MTGSILCSVDTPALPLQLPPRVTVVLKELYRCAHFPRKSYMPCCGAKKEDPRGTLLTIHSMSQGHNSLFLFLFLSLSLCSLFSLSLCLFRCCVCHAQGCFNTDEEATVESLHHIDVLLVARLGRSYRFPLHQLLYE